MTVTKVKKLLKIGDSYAVVLPKEFLDNGNVKEVCLEIGRSEIHITPKPTHELFKKDMEFFGKFGSGTGDLSVNRKKYLKEGLSAKRRSH